MSCWCHVTSKLCGIGPAERSWGGVKNIKTGKQLHMSGESTEKRSILYVSAKIQQSQILCDWLEKLDATENNAMFGDDDINFDMQLERFDVDTNQQLRTFFGHGSKNRRRKPERRMIVLRRLSLMDLRAKSDVVHGFTLGTSVSTYD